jgi:hypothetical protein
MTDTLEKPLDENEMSPEGKMTALLEKYQALAEEHAALTQQVTQRRILDELTAAARQLKIPDEIIQFDLQKYIVDFAINKDGLVVLRQDETQDASTVLALLQKERPHWHPKTTPAGNEPLGVTNNSSWFTKTTY